MAENFSLSIEGKGDEVSILRDDLENALNVLDPFSFLILDNGEAYMQVILDHDEFYDSVIEMRNYSETDWKHYRKIGMQLSEIILVFLSFYDNDILPQTSDWEDVTVQMQ